MNNQYSHLHSNFLSFFHSGISLNSIGLEEIPKSKIIGLAGQQDPIGRYYV